MEKKSNYLRTACLFMFGASIVFCIAHLVMIAIEDSTMGITSILLNVIPYGLPIGLFAYANRLRRKENWQKSDTVFLSLFSLCYLAMALHVTLGFIVPSFDFIDIYYNAPIMYMIPLVVIAIAWAVVHMRPSRQSTKAQKILFTLPFVALAAMVVHCVIVSIFAIKNSAQTSFPWWVMPLYVGVCYLLGVMVLMVAYTSFYVVAKRRLKTAK